MAAGRGRDPGAYEARIICAQGDGVGPSVLLSHAGGKGPQYLFNAPEGFARLVLEHKLRPSSSLAAAFLTSLRPDASGGLGGLMLRLSQDGHGHVALCGPPGTAAMVHSLRHIIRFRHPKVLVIESSHRKIGPIYEDEHLLVLPVLQGERQRVPPGAGGCICCQLAACRAALRLLEEKARVEMEMWLAVQKRESGPGGGQGEGESDGDGETSSSGGGSGIESSSESGSECRSDSGSGGEGESESEDESESESEGGEKEEEQGKGRGSKCKGEGEKEGGDEGEEEVHKGPAAGDQEKRAEADGGHPVAHLAERPPVQGACRQVCDADDDTKGCCCSDRTPSAGAESESRSTGSSDDKQGKSHGGAGDAGVERALGSRSGSGRGRGCNRRSEGFAVISCGAAASGASGSDRDSHNDSRGAGGSAGAGVGSAEGQAKACRGDAALAAPGHDAAPGGSPAADSEVKSAVVAKGGTAEGGAGEAGGSRGGGKDGGGLFDSLDSLFTVRAHDPGSLRRAFMSSIAASASASCPSSVAPAAAAPGPWPPFWGPSTSTRRPCPADASRLNGCAPLPRRHQRSGVVTAKKRSASARAPEVNRVVAPPKKKRRAEAELPSPRGPRDARIAGAGTGGAAVAAHQHPLACGSDRRAPDGLQQRSVDTATVNGLLSAPSPSGSARQLMPQVYYQHRQQQQQHPHPQEQQQQQQQQQPFHQDYQQMQPAAMEHGPRPPTLFPLGHFPPAQPYHSPQGFSSSPHARFAYPPAGFHAACLPMMALPCPPQQQAHMRHHLLSGHVALCGSPNSQQMAPHQHAWGPHPTFGFCEPPPPGQALWPNPHPMRAANPQVALGWLPPLAPAPPPPAFSGELHVASSSVRGSVSASHGHSPAIPATVACASAAAAAAVGAGMSGTPGRRLTGGHLAAPGVAEDGPQVEGELLLYQPGSQAGDWPAAETELPELPSGANPVFVRSPSGKLAPASSQMLDQQEGGRAAIPGPGPGPGTGPVLAYVCYLKRLDRAIAIVDCNDLETVASLAAALPASSSSSSCTCSRAPGRAAAEAKAAGAPDSARAAAAPSSGQMAAGGASPLFAVVIHLSPPRVLQSAQYCKWVASFADGGDHILVQGGAPQLGFLASLKTLAKLNAVAARNFPLPPLYVAESASRRSAAGNGSCPDIAGSGGGSLPQSCAVGDVGEEESGREHLGSPGVTNGRLLMKLVISASAGGAHAAVVDCSSCPELPDLAAVQAEVRARRGPASGRASPLAPGGNVAGAGGKSEGTEGEGAVVTGEPGIPGTSGDILAASRGTLAVTPGEPLPALAETLECGKEEGGGARLGTSERWLTAGGECSARHVSGSCHTAGLAVPPHVEKEQEPLEQCRGGGAPLPTCASERESKEHAQTKKAPARLPTGRGSDNSRSAEALRQRLTLSRAMSANGCSRSPPLEAGSKRRYFETAPQLDPSLSLRTTGATLQEWPSGTRPFLEGAEGEEEGEDGREVGRERKGEGKGEGEKHFEVTFLGTGSAEPSKYRGSSGILLRFSPQTPRGGGGGGLGRAREGWILLDAGEGVLGQLTRKFGQGRAAAVIASLAAVWVSHKHADHVLGLLPLVAARPPHASPLLLIGPAAAEKFLAEAGAALRASGVQLPVYEFVHCSQLEEPQGAAGRGIASPSSRHQHHRHQGGRRLRSPRHGMGGGTRANSHAPGDARAVLLDALMRQLQLTKLQAIPVEHCHDAWALLLEARGGAAAGWSLAYSGDTRPCARLAGAARGCTLLIHEATFEDGLRSHALSKRHSTASEALGVAADARAHAVVLTHFSQRYPGVPEVDELKSRNACVAFDGMVIPSACLPSLSALMPLLSLALPPPAGMAPEDTNEGQCQDLIVDPSEAREEYVSKGRSDRPTEVETATGSYDARDLETLASAGAGIGSGQRHLQSIGLSAEQREDDCVPLSQSTGRGTHIRWGDAD